MRVSADDRNPVGVEGDIEDSLVSLLMRGLEARGENDDSVDDASVGKSLGVAERPPFYGRLPSEVGWSAVPEPG